MSYEQREYKGAAVTTALSSGIGSGDLTITIDDATGWPTGGVNGPFFIVIDRGESTEEAVEVASRSATTLTVSSTAQRGIDDTSAVAHNAGAAVEHAPMAQDFTEANTHVVDTSRDDHTQYHDATRHAAVTHTQAMLGTDSVGTAQIQTDAVTSDELAAGATTPPQVDVFTTDGTWNKPTGAQSVLIEVLAAGGGGGGAEATASGEASAGSGGGAGGYAKQLFSAGTLGASETVTVGTGGAGSAGAAGASGGASSFGVHVTANGGSGGTVTTAGAGSAATGGGTGGTGSGDISATGGGGGAGFSGGTTFFTTAFGTGGTGGGSSLGGGGAGQASSAAGVNGSRGGGGGGAANGESQTSKAGGTGGDGIVVATSFF